MSSPTIHLKSVRLEQRATTEEAARFPFTIPALHSLTEITFTSPVTFLVGENGSGKSTLLESIAVASGITTAGSQDAEHDETLTAIRLLARELRLAWQHRSKRGFFLRAEDFFGYVKRLTRMRAELERDLAKVEKQFRGRSESALALARLPFQRELHELAHKYGGDLDGFSHGESFLRFFEARFVPNGLYLLDEPEAPLSPARQLALMSMMKQMVEQQTQFIIATHSPLLMAFPGATILHFGAEGVQRVDYDALEHVTLTRAFLNDPERFLQHL